MLTRWQVDLICLISGQTRFGLVMGAIVGLVVAATVQTIRAKTSGAAVAVIPASVEAIVPGALGGAIAGAVVAVGIAIFCPPGFKGGRDVPNWFIPLNCLAVLACAVAAAMRTTSEHDLRSKQWPFHLGSMAWVVIGALVGAVAGVGGGFEDYFRVYSNAEPIRCAEIGAVIAALGTFVWRLAIGRTSNKLPTPPAR